MFKNSITVTKNGVVIGGNTCNKCTRASTMADSATKSIAGGTIFGRSSIHRITKAERKAIIEARKEAHKTAIEAHKAEHKAAIDAAITAAKNAGTNVTSVTTTTTTTSGALTAGKINNTLIGPSANTTSITAGKVNNTLIGPNANTSGATDVTKKLFPIDVSKGGVVKMLPHNRTKTLPATANRTNAVRRGFNKR